MAVGDSSAFGKPVGPLDIVPVTVDWEGVAVGISGFVSSRVC
jgi:hypothetical protein